MNNSLVLRIGVALAFFSGLSLSLKNYIAIHEQAKRDLLDPCVTSVEQADIVPCPGEEVMLAGCGQERVAVKKCSPTSDGVTPGRIESQFEISEMGLARGLAPPLLVSV